MTTFTKCKELFRQVFTIVAADIDKLDEAKDEQEFKEIISTDTLILAAMLQLLSGFKGEKSQIMRSSIRAALQLMKRYETMIPSQLAR